MPDTRDLTAVIDESGYPIGWRTMHRPPLFVAAPIILARSAVPAVLTGTTVESVMASTMVPGGLLGPSGWLRVSAWFSATNNANSKQCKLQLGGQQVFSASNGNWQGYGAQSIIANRGSEAAQISTPINVNSILGVLGQPLRTYTIDTADDQLLELRGMLNVGSDVLTLEAWLVEAFPSE